MRQMIAAMVAGFTAGLMASWMMVAVVGVCAAEKMIAAESIAVVNAQGKLRAILALGENNSVGLVFTGPDGQTLSGQWMVNSNGESIVTFFDERGKTARMLHR